MIERVHFVRTMHSGRPIRWYVYAWRGGPCIMEVESPNKPKLTEDALKLLNAALIDSRSAKPNTLVSLIRRWRPESPEWRALAPSTKETWGYSLNAIEEKWGTTPLAVWSDPRYGSEGR